MIDYHKKTYAERHTHSDRTAYDRGRKRSGKHLPKSHSLGAAFRAIDGEGWTVQGKHRLVLLGTKDEAVYDAAGLGAARCFNFILGQADPKTWLVAFSFNYDVTMMIKDLPAAKLRELHTINRTTWRGYRLQYWRSKMFRVSQGERSATIYDTFGFFQTSFLKALQDYKLISDRDAATIGRMKARRGAFGPAQIEAIRSYNALECVYLERLMDVLRSAMNEAGLFPQQWHGAGAAAAALLKKHDVIDRLPHLDQANRSRVLQGYYGGRIELLRAGRYDQVYQYDIRSAYPWALSQLPTFTGAAQYRDRFDPEGFGLWRVEWSILPGQLAPFPFRLKRRIHWADSGSGWYWTPEVQTALAAYGPLAIKVREGWQYEDRGDRPFAFVKDYFDRRAELKARGSHAEKAIKLALNSLYGKLAQGIGYAGQPPAFQCYLVAGLMTSMIRARLLSIGSQQPRAIINFATDGIMSSADLGIPLGSGLGDWEFKAIDHLFILQTGFYQADHFAKHRGFRSSEIDWGKIRSAFRRRGIGLQLDVTFDRFVGLGSALAWDRLPDLGQWIKMTKTISGRTSKLYIPHNDTFPNADFQNVRFRQASLSESYVPKGGDLIADADESQWHTLGMDQPNIDELTV